MSHRAQVLSTARQWHGSPRRISRSTPLGEVKGVEPVKFIAREELTVTIHSAKAARSKGESVGVTANAQAENGKADHTPLTQN
jgi:hypothetical protein